MRVGLRHKIMTQMQFLSLDDSGRLRVYPSCKRERYRDLLILQNFIGQDKDDDSINAYLNSPLGYVTHLPSGWSTRNAPLNLAINALC